MPDSWVQEISDLLSRVEGGIDVVRVLHGARNIRRALRETDS